MKETRFVSKAYDGPSGVCRESDIIGFEDMPEGKDVPLTISHVEDPRNFELPNKSVKKRALLLFFEETDKFLILGREKKEPLDRMFGRTTGGWAGKRVRLYGDPNVKMKGKRVGGVRIRDIAAQQAQSDAEAMIPDESGEDWPEGYDPGPAPNV